MGSQKDSDSLLQQTIPKMPPVQEPKSRGDLNRERMQKLEEISGPIVEFMNTYCCPHDVIIIEQGHISLYSGECSIPTRIPD